jgi:hypothetical protein
MLGIGCIGDLMTFGRTPRCSLVGFSRYSIIEEGKTCGQDSRNGIIKAISSPSTAMEVRSTKSKAVTKYFKAFLAMLPP